MTAITPARGTVAGAIARAWLRVYTCGLAESVRERRAQELESDLWEHEADRFGEDTPPGLVGLEIFGRMVRGMPADLMWRFQVEGPQMELKIPFERVTGVLLLALVVLIPIAVGIDGYDTRRNGWESELLRLADLSGTQTKANLVVQTLSGICLIVAGAGLYLALVPRARNFATVSAFGLAAAGVLTLAASAMYLVLSTLADDYAAGRGGDDLVVTSRAVGLAMQSFAASAGFLLALSVYLLAIAAHRHSLVPRAFAWIVGASVVSLVAAVVWELATGGDSWILLMAGFVLVLVWLLAAGASLLFGLRHGGSGLPAASASAV